MFQKKKIVSLLCALALTASLAACQDAPSSTSSPESTSSTSISGLPQSSIFSGGTGTEEDPYQISTVEQLDAVRDDMTAHYILTADLDLSNVENWEPIGAYNPSVSEDDPNAFADSFSGTFDGNGHVISHLTSHHEDGVGVGLIGLTSEHAVVKNLTISQADCSGMMAVAAVIGYNCGTAEHLQANGKVTSIAYNCVGGIIGGNMGGTVSGCSTEDSTVTVLGENNYTDGRYILEDSNECGGLVIGGSFGGTIANCSGTGTVISEGHDAMGLGGVAGCLESMESITGCSADVTIRAGKNAHGIGGLCGFSGTFDLSAPALVSGCTVNAQIECSEGATHVGGLIGTGLYMNTPDMESVFQIQDCSVTATITGAVTPGAVAGRAEGSTIESCEVSVIADGNPLTNAVGQTSTKFESAE